MAQKKGMRHLADIDVSLRHDRALELRVAFQAEIGIPFHQEFGIYRSVGGMAYGTAFPQGFMLEYKRPGLLAVALGTTLVQPGHR